MFSTILLVAIPLLYSVTVQSEQPFVRQVVERLKLLWRGFSVDFNDKPRLETGNDWKQCTNVKSRAHRIRSGWSVPRPPFRPPKKIIVLTYTYVRNSNTIQISGTVHTTEIQRTTATRGCSWRWSFYFRDAISPSVGLQDARNSVRTPLISTTDEDWNLMTNDRRLETTAENGTQTSNHVPIWRRNQLRPGRAATVKQTHTH